MRERLGRAPEFHLRADVVPSGEAERTLLAGLADLEGYMVTDLERGNVGAYRIDDPRGLMAQREGFADEDVPVPEMVEVVQV